MSIENSASLATLPVQQSAEAVADRRGFIKHLTIGGTLVLGVGGAAAQCGRFLRPNVLYGLPKVFKVGGIEQVSDRESDRH